MPEAFAQDESNASPLSACARAFARKAFLDSILHTQAHNSGPRPYVRARFASTPPSSRAAHCAV